MNSFRELSRPALMREMIKLAEEIDELSALRQTKETRGQMRGLMEVFSEMTLELSSRRGDIQAVLEKILDGRLMDDKLTRMFDEEFTLSQLQPSVKRIRNHLGWQ